MGFCFCVSFFLTRRFHTAVAFLKAPCSLWWVSFTQNAKKCESQNLVNPTNVSTFELQNHNGWAYSKLRGTPEHSTSTGSAVKLDQVAHALERITFTSQRRSGHSGGGWSNWLNISDQYENWLTVYTIWQKRTLKSTVFSRLQHMSKGSRSLTERINIIFFFF